MQKEKECQFDHFKYQHYNFQYEREKSVSIQQEVSTKLHKLQQRRWQMGMFQLIAP